MGLQWKGLHCNRHPSIILGGTWGPYGQPKYSALRGHSEAIHLNSSSQSPNELLSRTTNSQIPYNTKTIPFQRPQRLQVINPVTHFSQ